MPHLLNTDSQLAQNFTPTWCVLAKNIAELDTKSKQYIPAVHALIQFCQADDENYRIFNNPQNINFQVEIWIAAFVRVAEFPTPEAAGKIYLLQMIKEYILKVRGANESLFNEALQQQPAEIRKLFHEYLRNLLLPNSHRNRHSYFRSPSLMAGVAGIAGALITDADPVAGLLWGMATEATANVVSHKLYRR